MPLNSRQKIILLFLLKQSEAVGHTALMKWLFLFSTKRSSSVSSYNFVPYKYGPFSFEASRDIKYTLAQYVEEVERGYRLRPAAMLDVQSITSKLVAIDTHTSEQVWAEVHKLSRSSLLQQVYKDHPWYASRSELQPNTTCQGLAETAIYTVGYEGLSVDAFFNILLQRGVQSVLDVRRNAYSHKYGFTGHALGEICNKLNLQYHHSPQLGIASELRQNLNRDSNLKILFEDYENGLSNLQDAVQDAGAIIRELPTVLLCFEKEPSSCHRSRLATRLSSDLNLPVIHL